MTPRLVATAGAFTSLLFGAAGLAVPTAMASGFGISLDATGTLTFANDFFLELTGWRREEVVGKD